MNTTTGRGVKGWSVVFALLALGLSPSHSRAEADEVTPPALLRFVEADVPAVEESSDRHRSVVVELSLTIGVDGDVSHAEVVETGGRGFDEAALAAVLQFHFAPAVRGGEAFVVRIRYRYVFHPVEEVETPLVERAPVVESPPRETFDGMTPDADDPVYGAVGEVAAVEGEVLTRSVGGSMLTRIPGTRGDPLRAIEILPGVGRPSFLDGGLQIRGAAPRNTQTFFDGMPIPLAFHFGGLTSFTQASFIDRIDFYPGNFSVRYGRRIGGVVDVVASDPERVFQAAAELSLVDASAYAQFPLGANAAAKIGFRRSLMELTIAPFVRQFGVRTTQFPVYYDWNGVVLWTPTPQDRVRVMVYGSSDRFELSEAISFDAGSAGGGSYTTRFGLGHLSWEHRFDDQTDLEVALQYGRVRADIEAVGLTAVSHQVHGRAELTHRPIRHFALSAGLDVSMAPFRFEYAGVRLGATEPQNYSVFVEGEQEWTLANRPAFFVESRLSLSRMNVRLGVRADYDSPIRRWNLDPRMNASFRLARDWEIRAGVGVFSQAPELWESSSALGSPELDWTHSLQTTLGVQYESPGGELRASLDGFYKTVWDRVVRPVRGELSNQGSGRNYGAELGARVRPTTSLPLFAQLSYTLMRSELRDAPEGAWRSSDFDQTHVFSLTLSYRLPRGWEVGLGMRVVSGNPYTGLEDTSFDPESGRHYLVYGPWNGERHGVYHRLDARVAKTWTFDAWRLAFFLDVRNVYNQRNTEGIVYTSDDQQSIPVYGLPIIPSIGLRGTLL